MHKVMYKDQTYLPQIGGVTDVLVNGTSVVTNGAANVVVPVIHLSTTVPTSSDGNNGDIWLVYTAPSNS